MNRERWFFTVLFARAIRSVAYGGLGVVVGIALARRGFSPSQIGAYLSLTLSTGAIFSFSAAALARRIGEKSTLMLGCALMAVSGTLLAGFSSAPILAAAFGLGTLTAGGQEVGPFAALEQAAIGARSPRVTSGPYALYNTISITCSAAGAACVAFVSIDAVLWFYPLSAVLLLGAYALLPAIAPPASVDTLGMTVTAPRRRFGTTEQLTLLFGVDALAGGFVVQAVIAYWFHLRFGTPAATIGPLLAAANVLSAISFFAAARLAKRFGLLNTMVFTHLPSNVLLLLVPFMPSFAWAAALLLARFALSQMDVPTRQAYVMNAVSAPDRLRAASMTTAVRPAASAISPLLAGIAMQGAAFGAPFVLAGSLKIAYDLALFFRFRRHPL
jgi:MFS family permease